MRVRKGSSYVMILGLEWHSEICREASRISLTRMIKEKDKAHQRGPSQRVLGGNTTPKDPGRNAGIVNLQQGVIEEDLSNESGTPCCPELDLAREGMIPKHTMRFVEFYLR